MSNIKIDEIHNNDSGSNLYHLNDKYQLVECIDRQKGFMLLKNLIPHNTEDYYAVAAELSDKRPTLPENFTWMNHSNADKLMAFLIKKSSYNKASKDWKKSSNS